MHIIHCILRYPHRVVSHIEVYALHSDGYHEKGYTVCDHHQAIFCNLSNRRRQEYDKKMHYVPINPVFFCHPRVNRHKHVISNNLYLLCRTKYLVVQLYFWNSRKDQSEEH